MATLKLSLKMTEYLFTTHASIKYLTSFQEYIRRFRPADPVGEPKSTGISVSYVLNNPLPSESVFPFNTKSYTPWG